MAKLSVSLVGSSNHLVMLLIADQNLRSPEASIFGDALYTAVR